MTCGPIVLFLAKFPNFTLGILSPYEAKNAEKPQLLPNSQVWGFLYPPILRYQLNLIYQSGPMVPYYPDRQGCVRGQHVRSILASSRPRPSFFEAKAKTKRLWGQGQGRCCRTPLRPKSKQQFSRSMKCWLWGNKLTKTKTFLKMGRLITIRFDADAAKCSQHSKFRPTLNFEKNCALKANVFEDKIFEDKIFEVKAQARLLRGQGHANLSWSSPWGQCLKCAGTVRYCVPALL